MGNCVASVVYVAHETWHPGEDVFEDLPQDKEDPIAEKNKDLLKNEKPLKITLDDKLRMIMEETGLVGPGGTRLFKMKNLTTGKTGLVLEDSIARIGTIECEK